MFIPFFFTLCITVSHISFSSGATCTPNSKSVAIELVLAQGNSQNYNRFIEQLKAGLMLEVTKKVTETYGEAKFGLTTFGDWTSRTWRLRDVCYKLYSTLTASVDAMLQSLKTVELGHGGDPKEASLTGVALSVTDLRMGWSANRFTKDHRRIVRVLAVVADSASLMSEDIVFSLPFWGDGTDSCRSNIPKLDVVGRLLVQHEISVLGLIAEKAVQTWEGYLKDMHAHGVVKTFDVGNSAKFSDIVMEGLKEIVCEHEPPPARVPVGTIVGASLGVLGLLGAAGGGGYYMYARKKQAAKRMSDEDEDEDEEMQPSESRDLSADTDSFA